MRLSERISVLLPQPEGPISAVIRCWKTSIETSATAGLPA